MGHGSHRRGANLWWHAQTEGVLGPVIGYTFLVMLAVVVLYKPQLHPWLFGFLCGLVVVTAVVRLYAGRRTAGSTCCNWRWWPSRGCFFGEHKGYE